MDIAVLSDGSHRSLDRCNFSLMCWSQKVNEEKAGETLISANLECKEALFCLKMGLVLEGSTPKIEDVHGFQEYGAALRGLR